MIPVEVYKKSPRTMIAYAIHLAEEGVFISSEFPFYVRDEAYTWTGYCNFGQYGVILTAGTLDELYDKMLQWLEELNEEENKSKEQG